MTQRDAMNDDLLRRMCRGELPTGFEHLTDRELFDAMHGPPEDGDNDSPEYALGLLRESASRTHLTSKIFPPASALPADTPTETRPNERANVPNQCEKL